MKLSIFIFLLPIFLIAQKTANINGIIHNKYNKPIEGVTISYLNKGTTTNKNGAYSFVIPINKTVTVIFSHISYKTIYKKFIAREQQTFNFSPIIEAKNEQLEEVVIKNKEKEAQGILKIDSEKIKNSIGANAGVETILMTLPGVSNNNELSTQYNVRGGNYDENLVYVNGIEVYRPFLVRSGQQEGLSFINPNMTQNVVFSAGGFQAKYGDKLSSVLDISYKKPTKLNTKIDLSLLGGGATIENVFLNKKISTILGVRYRNNSLFVNSKDIEIDFKPNFTDIQGFLNYTISNNVTLQFLGNFSLNNYNYKPLTRKTRFGTTSKPLELFVFYEGKEKDRYKTLFGAFSTIYKVNKKLKIKATISSFNTQEEEYLDVLAQYHLGEINTTIGGKNFGKVDFYKGIASQLNHARNDLDALISNINLKATLKDNQNQWQTGIKYQTENIKDHIREWELIDDSGFTVSPAKTTKPKNEPYSPYNEPLNLSQSVRAKNNVTINRFLGFIQFSRKTYWNDHQFWINLGVRTQHWQIISKGYNNANHLIISPRVQFAIKPNWNKDMLFRMSGGWYSQPPFYKELRDYNGQINPKVKAQKSIHFVIGNDYDFTMWKRPFKLTSEIYYKNLSDINAYSIDNVRIRYRADNLTNAYAYGLDLRLNGEFVPGNDSWFSLGYLKTAENINNQGFIARPNDQRLKFGILFQDYVPNLPNFKAYINLVYNTGVPGGSPAYANVYKFQSRLNDYKRADLGISYVFTDLSKPHTTGFFKSFKEFTAGIELFNIFDINNAITNTWVKDVQSKHQYGIPNYMTGRVLNFKTSIVF